ncbi:MAG: extracellular solute-binding protein [Propionibacteriaceae bacterium]|jgi:raffinose/stachyose/melibiose transport system substrate-binding protein|nr:extracellular solute-binding protein [Propionibacteriaceae bacterium]
MPTKTSGHRKFARSAVAALAATCLATLSACSGGSQQPAAQSVAPDELSGKLSIVLSSNGPSDKAFEDFTTKFKAKYPKVDAVFTPISNEVYPQTKSAQLTSGEADIVMTDNVMSYPEYAEFAKAIDQQTLEAGGFLDLTDQAFLKNYTSSIVDSMRFDGKVYTLPVAVQYVTGLYYNKQIFEDNKLTAPTTWAELQDTMDKLKKAGIPAFGWGGKDVWPAGLLMNDVVAGVYPTDSDKTALRDGIWDGSVKLDADKPLTVMERVQTCFENSLETSPGLGYDEVPALFAKGKFAMLPDGTWNHTSVLDAVGDKFEVGYIPFPGGDSATDNKSLDYKLDFTLAINAQSKNPQAALAYLEMLSDPENYAAWINTAGSSPSQPNIKTDDFLDSIADVTTDAPLVWEKIWIASPESGEAAQFPFNYPDIKPLGKDSAADAAKAAQEAWHPAS